MGVIHKSVEENNKNVQGIVCLPTTSDRNTVMIITRIMKEVLYMPALAFFLLC